MKLNKPKFTICFVVILMLNLVFFSFLILGKNIVKENTTSDIVNNFDFKNYLLMDDEIKNSINNYKYPKEVYNYLDELKINLIKKKIINGLKDNSNSLVIKDDIKEVLDNSVYEYQYISSKEIYSFVSKDINSFSERFTDTLNNNISKGYIFVKNISSGLIYYLSITISIILLMLIIIFEKNNGFLITGLFLLLYSFFVYYMDKHFIETIFKYINNINVHLDNLYCICFIIGFVLLLIYIVIKLKKVFRDLRIKSYNRNWR